MLVEKMYALIKTGLMNKRKLTRKEKINRAQEQKRHKQELLEKKQTKKIGLWLIVIGLLLILGFGNSYLKPNDKIKQEDLLTIKGSIQNELIIKTKRRQGRSMLIKLAEYPELDFKISDLNIDALNMQLKNKPIGHEVELDILKEDAPDITTTKILYVYAIRDKERAYLSLSDYNWAIKQRREGVGAYVFLAFSFSMFAYGIYLVKVSVNL